MAGEPTIAVCGNATADAEIRYLSSGAGVASWTLACTPRVKKGDEWSDGETVYYRCSAWRQLGENCVETITRGMRLVVVGRLKVRSYEKDGEKRTSIELDVDHVGPDLRNATATVRKVSRGSDSGGSGAAPADDPWGSPAPAATSDDSDEPPF